MGSPTKAKIQLECESTKRVKDIVAERIENDLAIESKK